MYHRTNRDKTGTYSNLLCGRRPFAKAELYGSIDHPKIKGTVEFFATPLGVVISTEISGLPYDSEGGYESQIYGFHIHNVGKCTGSADEPFADAGEHFDKSGGAHPAHSGDMPSLFGNNGYAWGAFLTNRFSPEDIIGRSVIVHANADDMITDPSGNSGKRIACGIIASA